MTSHKINLPIFISTIVSIVYTIISYVLIFSAAKVTIEKLRLSSVGQGEIMAILFAVSLAFGNSIILNKLLKKSNNNLADLIYYLKVESIFFALGSSFMGLVLFIEDGSRIQGVLLYASCVLLLSYIIFAPLDVKKGNQYPQL